MKQNKVKKSYCKQHGCFDDCSEKVAKKMDDGIHHLTSVERIRTSPETRAGTLQPLVVGRRKVDGTPKTGTDSSLSSKINADVRSGRSGRSKPVGGTKIREQIGKAAPSPHQAFVEVVKFGHSTAELKRMGQEEKARFKTEGNPTRFQRNFAGTKEGRRGYRADVKGGRVGALKALTADTIRHPLAMHSLNVNAGYRTRAVARKGALEHKAKKAAKVSKSAFLEEVAKKQDRDWSKGRYQKLPKK